MDQYIGLKPEAVNYLNREMVPVSATIDVDFATRTIESKIETLVRREVYSQINGAWQDIVANLHEYTWPSGEVCREIIQAEPWSSGPMYFLCLEITGGENAGQKIYEWTDEEMSQY